MKMLKKKIKLSFFCSLFNLNNICSYVRNQRSIFLLKIIEKIYFKFAIEFERILKGMETIKKVLELSLLKNKNKDSADMKIEKHLMKERMRHEGVRAKCFHVRE